MNTNHVRLIASFIALLALVSLVANSDRFTANSVFTAVDPDASCAVQSNDIEELRFEQHESGDAFDWAGLQEKWVQDQEDAWYFITPQGSLHKWNGTSATSFVTGTAIGTFPKAYYENLDLLTAWQGTRCEDSTEDCLRETIVVTDLRFAADEGESYENWGKLDEKWVNDTNGNWYFILPSGSLHAWNGSSNENFVVGPSLAIFPERFYEDTTLLAGWNGQICGMKQAATTAEETLFPWLSIQNASVSTKEAPLTKGVQTIGSFVIETTKETGLPNIDSMSFAIDKANVGIGLSSFTLRNIQSSEETSPCTVSSVEDSTIYVQCKNIPVQEGIISKALVSLEANVLKPNADTSKEGSLQVRLVRMRMYVEDINVASTTYKKAAVEIEATDE